MAPINYELHKNHLTADADDYTARVRPNGSADLDDVIDYMTKNYRWPKMVVGAAGGAPIFSHCG